MKPHQQSQHQVGSTPPKIEPVDRLVLVACISVTAFALFVGWISTEPVEADRPMPAQVATQK